MQNPKHLVWFSCGAPSSVTALLVAEENPRALNVRCVVENEHPDNTRFANEFSLKTGLAITEVWSKKYADCWDVWERTRFLNSPNGARCATEMKKVVRRDMSSPGDIHCFGFTFEEKERSESFARNNFDINCRFPLVERKVRRQECFLIIQKLGIPLPEMYRMGFNNANCVGCVKGGRGYWNKIRVHFPTVFKRMATLERSIKASCINGVYLDELHPDAGRHENLELPECGLFCDEPEPQP